MLALFSFSIDQEHNSHRYKSKNPDSKEEITDLKRDRLHNMSQSAKADHCDFYFPFTRK